jgi:hypothetical protein
MDILSYILSKKYTDTAIEKAAAASGNISIKVVNELPEIGQSNIFYLVSNGTSKKKNYYSEYI